VLESDKFLPNLRMADSSGEEYPLMSSRHLRILLENTAAADWPFRRRPPACRHQRPQKAPAVVQDPAPQGAAAERGAGAAP